MPTPLVFCRVAIDGVLQTRLSITNLALFLGARKGALRNLLLQHIRKNPGVAPPLIVPYPRGYMFSAPPVIAMTSPPEAYDRWMLKEAEYLITEGHLDAILGGLSQTDKVDLLKGRPPGTWPAAQ